MRRTALSLGAFAAAALALPATAAATDYCVLPASSCTAPHTYPATGAGVQSALDAAGAANDSDKVFLGAARYTSPTTSGFAYVHLSAPVELIGAGTGATTLAAPQTSIQSLNFSSTASAIVRDMTIDLPYKTSGGFPTALRVLGATARNVAVVTDPTAPANTYGANAVELAGGTFLDGSVTLPTVGSFAAIGTNGPGNTVRNSTLTAKLPVNINADNATLSGLRITAGPTDDAVAIRAVGVTLADSTIFQPGPPPAVATYTGNGVDAAITLDHDTIVGDDAPGSSGLYAGATAPNGKSASITMRNSILTRVTTALVRGVAVGGGASNITTSYSDYPPTSATFGSGGSGAVSEGAGNINSNPAFVNASADFRLTAGSPAIDVGDPTGLLGGEPNVDLLGLPRIVNGTGNAGCVLRSDMGAFEFPAKPTAHAALVGTATAEAPASFTGAGSTEPYAKPLTFAWAFDDGGAATGATPQHVFATAGPHAATLTVTGPCGHADTTVASFAVGPKSPTTAPPPPPAADKTPPVISHLVGSPSRFKAVGAKTAAKRGTVLRFSLTEAATVKLAIVREVKGHKVGGKCRSRGHGPRCTITKTVTTLAAAGARGANAVAFTGRVRGRALPAGTYRVVATATDASGNRTTHSVKTRIAVLRG
ncbi:MAG: repeat protein [Solirubrobacterales bacterium]|nr:repeat protein [Solirubrobacterales bacterium]